MIEEMGKRAARVAAEHGDLQAAKADKQAATAELLRAVVDAVRPALPALCSKMHAHDHARSVRVLNVGHNLYLAEHGGWIESLEGGALLLVRTDEEVARAFVAEDVVGAISDALSRQAGAREWGTAEIRREAERLRAAVLLLRGPL